ncbi:type II secretion system F family protein [Ilumatobacter sp.]|uniref:type II secretion system F family protein n=1 Tax=Ilumatobacter sp. TaxID=1967498 RepID=UPI003B51B87A
MELVLVLGAVAVVGSLVVLWWSLSARPSPAQANLLAGMAGTAPPPPPLVAAMRRVGERTRRALPNRLVDGLEVNLVQAGHPGGLDLPRVLGIKLSLAVVAALVPVVTGHPVLAAVAGVVAFFLPDYWVLSMRDRREAAIRSDAADIIDQMTICVEAGLGFDAALARVASTTDGPLTDELRRTLSDIGAGVPRTRALRALADRTRIVEIRQLVSALLQAQKHGVSLAETLRVQAAELRLKRSQRTEEKAAKLAVKLIFPIVVCFLPVFFIVTLVPALITIFRTL